MSKSHSDTKRFPLAARLGTSASLLTLIAMGAISPVHAQDEEEGDAIFEEEIVVRGMRSSIQSAQQLKRAANQIQDSIIAEDIGKLPDRSIAEALQRVPGVTVSRFDQPTDPEHFAGEGAGVSLRGLPQVRAELNGRDIFSANDGRALSFDDVPAELMAGVDVYKTPTADMVEGGLGGIVNLRTRMPFDNDGQLVSGTVKANYGDQISETNFEGSALYSNVWDTDLGKLGLLVDFSTSEISSRADNLYNRAFIPRTDIAEYPGATVYVPRGADWRRNDYTRDRNGRYLALQLAPNENLEFYLTAFESRAKREWTENAFFIDGGGPLARPVAGNNDWVLDGNNVFQSGTLTSTIFSNVDNDPPVANPTTVEGFAFGTSSRLSTNRSNTSDYSLGFEWLNDGWTVSGDYQRVLSDAATNDYTYGTVAFPPTVRISNLRSSNGPSIDVPDNYLGDLDNYAFGQMQSLPKDNNADSSAARLDVQYDFDDSIVQSVKAGVRFSEKNATNREGSNWSARVQPWNLGGWLNNDLPIPTIESAGGSNLMREFGFDDFQRGDANVPVSGWMLTPQAVSNFEATTDAMIAFTPGGCCGPNYDALDLENNIGNINRQEERSQAAYIMGDFAFTERFGGNIGVRYVSTENDAIGQLSFPTFEIDDVMPFYQDPIEFVAENDYSFVLPSMNLRFDATDELVLRVSASQGIWKPEFWRLKSIWSFNAGLREGVEEPPLEDLTLDMLNFTLSSNGTNPYLEPMKADQYDATVEWYFDDAGGSLYAGIFMKDVSDFFRTQLFSVQLDGTFNGDPQSFTVSGDTVANVGTADIRGAEIGLTYYFDFLPEPFNGLGVSTNYTLVENDTDVDPTSGTGAVDTDGSDIEVDVLEGLAENTFNFTLMYENDAFWARLAYAWTDQILQSIGPNGWNGNNNGVAWQLPVFADDYGQLDLSMGYNFNDNLSLNFEAYNISQSDTKGKFIQNVAGERTAFVYSQDTRYGLSLRFTY